MNSSFETRENILQGLRPMRWHRGLAFFGVLLPTLFTIAAVIINKVSPGSTSFLVSGAPWTHRFWSVMFYTFVAGWFLFLMNLARVCPRCGMAFYKRHGWKPRRSYSTKPPPSLQAKVNVNVFGASCLNCGLKLDGSNVDESVDPAQVGK
jgi:hypothetical protein